ncbi:hypothetical protein ACU5AX_07775 [Sphingomonas sp. XXL09]|uniref:hypothetical protein n=1 Tax=Sphingomonas sp. XXL09 TaxID=3457787 RepID=UPI00406BD74B
MEAAYHISADTDQSFIVITFKDTFWDYDIKTKFVGDTVKAIMSLGCKFGDQRIIVDLRNAVLQSQSTITSLQKFLSDPSGGKVALVAETPMARMQTKRLQVRDGVQMFPTIPEAEEWLGLHSRSSVAA